MRLGTLADSTELNVDVELRHRDPAALADYATAVSTPGNPLYEHYLARGEFANVFGPTQAAISAVTQQLRSDGLQPGPISSNHLIIPVRASATQLQKAFSIGFERYQLPGRVAYTNTQAPLLSGSVASYVLGVAGLDDLYLPHALDLRKPQATPRRSATPRVVTGGPQPCSTAVTDAPDNDAYTADQIASAYNFSSLYGAGDEGAGITVALFELEPDLTSDIAAYQSCYGTSATVNYIEEDGGAGSGAGSGEAALDIEDIIGLAPLATIDVYQAPNSGTGLIDNYTAIVDKDTAQVVSTSWGLCESEAGSPILSEEATLFEQAATQGQSVFAAAGDDGSDGLPNELACSRRPGQPALCDQRRRHYVVCARATSERDCLEREFEWRRGRRGRHLLAEHDAFVSVIRTVISACHQRELLRLAVRGRSGRLLPRGPRRLGERRSLHGLPHLLRRVLDRHRWHERSCAAVGRVFTHLWTPRALAAASASGSPTRRSMRPRRRTTRLITTTSPRATTTTHQRATSGGLYPAGSGYDMASGLGTPNGGNLAGDIVRRGQPAQHRDGHQPRQPDHDRRRLGQLADQGQGLGRRRLELLGRRSAPRPVDQHLRSRHRHADAPPARTRSP